MVRAVGARVRDVPDPEPGPGQVLIETRAIGCNFPDILMVQGKYQVKPPLPFSPGHEIAGVVRAVGPGVSRVRPGERVIANLEWGGYAERAVTAADARPSDPGRDAVRPGGRLFVVYQTGYCALVQRAALQPGEWLLVHGAAGGVGLAAVQLGKALGARVIATAGTQEKLEVARQAGADVLIDYRTEDWVERVKAVTGGEGADVIYDPVGGDVFDGSTKCIAFEGRLLTIGFAGGRIPTLAINRVLLKNISVVGVHWGYYQRRGSPLVQEWMDALLELYAEGRDPARDLSHLSPPRGRRRAPRAGGSRVLRKGGPGCHDELHPGAAVPVRARAGRLPARRLPRLPRALRPGRGRRAPPRHRRGPGLAGAARRLDGLRGEEPPRSGRRLINRIENFYPYHAGFKALFDGDKLLGRVSDLLGEPAVLFKDKINFKLRRRRRLQAAPGPAGRLERLRARCS